MQDFANIAKACLVLLIEFIKILDFFVDNYRLKFYEHYVYPLWDDLFFFGFLCPLACLMWIFRRPLDRFFCWMDRFEIFKMDWGVMPFTKEKLIIGHLNKVSEQFLDLIEKSKAEPNMGKMTLLIHELQKIKEVRTFMEDLVNGKG